MSLRNGGRTSQRAKFELVPQPLQLYLTCSYAVGCLESIPAEPQFAINRQCNYPKLHPSVRVNSKEAERRTLPSHKANKRRIGQDEVALS